MRRTVGLANDPVAARARREFEYVAEADDLARERTITVSALTENAGGVGITVLVNRTVAQQGKPSLAKSKWLWCAFKIPGKVLKQKSGTIAIQNDSGDDLYINCLFLQHLPPEGDRRARRWPACATVPPLGKASGIACPAAESRGDPT